MNRREKLKSVIKDAAKTGETYLVTFDFDGTLDREDVQDYALFLKTCGIKVSVVTSRYDEMHKHRYAPNPCNEDLWKVTNSLTIHPKDVRFTLMEPKINYLKHARVVCHLDNDPEELAAIAGHTAGPWSAIAPIDVTLPSWELGCNEAIISRITADIEHHRELMEHFDFTV